MNFLSITVILISLLIIQKFQSIDGSAEQIYEKVKQEVEDLIDSQDYGSVNEIVKDSKVKVKFLDYYVATTFKPTELTTTILPPVKESGAMTRDGDEAAPAVGEDPSQAKEEGGSVIIYVVVLVVVAIVVGLAIGVFFFVRQSKAQKNRIFKIKKPKRSTSRESLASIETVASDTGKPVHPKPAQVSAAKPVTKKK